MNESIFILVALMSIGCSVVLFRGYRATRNRLLLWCALSFAFLALNNVFLCVDLLLYANIDLNGPLWRNLLSAGAGALLLFGLIGEIA